MTLHIFNPEHDIALASGLSNFTAPHAGRQLCHDLGFLPAIWAKEEDTIVVDDVAQAEREWKKTAHRLEKLLGRDCFKAGNRKFLTWKQLVSLKETARIDPWGWNIALRAVLLRRGVDERLMPSLRQLDVIRNLSHRHTAAQLLPKLRMAGTVGESFECRTAEEVETLLEHYGQLVMKAPWSSSGRGLRFLSVGRTPFQMQAGWFNNLVATQGCVMIEPYYNKVEDFGMEFQSDGCGNVSYLGLSLFHTENGAYTGNVLSTEAVKRESLCHYLSTELLDKIQAMICLESGSLFKDRYCGPFGVDMMVVSGTNGSAALLHPCVEINLRRTMGHVALALSPQDDDIRCVMRIEYSNERPSSAASVNKNYKLTINKL